MKNKLFYPDLCGALRNKALEIFYNDKEDSALQIAYELQIDSNKVFKHLSNLEHKRKLEKRVRRE